MLMAPVCADTIPDFAHITNVKQKKTAFFDYMYPLVLVENKKILLERATLMSAAKSDLAAQKKICKKYSNKCDVVDAEKIKKLLRRVDVIPPSLALAQSANESAWGSSRFAKRANNYFGQWCYVSGCGIVPKQRHSESSHEVRKFDSPQDSVGSYIFNLNTSNAYRDLRKHREQLRNEKVNVTGSQLAEWLLKYSQRREQYVKEIKSMISKNKLEDIYDKKFWVEVNKYPQKTDWKLKIRDFLLNM